MAKGTYLKNLTSKRILFAALAFVAALAGIALFLYFRNLHNVVYVADDFAYARRVDDYGIVGAQYSWYASPTESFTGRLGSTALISLVHMFGPGHTGVLLVGVTTLILFFVTTSTYLLYKSWHSTSPKTVILMASLATVTTAFVGSIVLSPEQYQLTLWAPGLFIYFLPLYIIGAGYALMHTRLGLKGNTARYIGLAVIFLAALASESIALIGLIALAVIYASSFLAIDHLSLERKRLLAEPRRLYPYLAGLLLLAFSLQYFAPGTQRRIALLSPSESIQESLKASLMAIFNYFSVAVVEHWGILIILFAVGLCVGIIFLKMANSRKAERRVIVIKRLFSLLSYLLASSLLLSVVSIFPSHYATRDIPTRTLAPLSFLLTGIPLAFGYLAACLIGVWSQRKVLILVLVLTSLSLFGFLNFKSYYYQVTQNVLNYRIAFFAREKEVRAKLEAGKDISVDTELPDIYPLAKLTSNSTDWFNIDMAKYYSLTSIRLKDAQ